MFGITNRRISKANYELCIMNYLSCQTTLDNFNDAESHLYYNRNPAIYRFSSGVKYI